MGSQMAAQCSGQRLWLRAGRSLATMQRAQDAGLVAVDTLEAMAEQADVIVSICPPDAALGQAKAVSAARFTGVYVDANAISPATARAIGALFSDAVDGGIIGSPPTEAGTSRLYLSGEQANEVAALWAGSLLEALVVPGPVGAASAVKMCFAAWTKGSGALLMNIRALAEAEGVTDSIVSEWEQSMPDILVRAERTAAAMGPKAWRFVGEMDEIAASFASAGLPTGFHVGAAEVFERMAGFKNSDGPTLAEVTQALLEDPNA